MEIHHHPNYTVGGILYTHFIERDLKKEWTTLSLTALKNVSNSQLPYWLLYSSRISVKQKNAALARTFNSKVYIPQTFQVISSNQKRFALHLKCNKMLDPFQNSCSMPAAWQRAPDWLTGSIRCCCSKTTWYANSAQMCTPDISGERNTFDFGKTLKKFDIFPLERRAWKQHPPTCRRTRQVVIIQRAGSTTTCHQPPPPQKKANWHSFLFFWKMGEEMKDNVGCWKISRNVKRK